MATILRAHDQYHIARMFMQEQRVNTLFATLSRDIGKLLRKYKESSTLNVWRRNAEIERAIDRLLIDFNLTLEREIRSGALKSWNLANDKNNKIVERYLQNMSVSDIVRSGMMNRNMEAFDAMINRVEGGMNLSKRVWNITTQTKDTVEMMLSSGIATGRSAEQIGRDLRQILNNPDARFRRVRDKNGKLVPSEPMKNYNPGQGVYRSARMNAIRLAGTEINMAYRTADHERWAKLDFILGYEVHRSQNHKPCKVCDALVGRYPKDFKFMGFHPFCICYATPVQMSHDDFADYLLEGKIPSDKIIKDIPPEARRFFDENPTYKENSYVGKENKGWFGKHKQNDSEASPTQGGVIEAAYPEITQKIVDVENNIRKNSKFETAVAFDKNGNIVLDKRGEATRVIFTSQEEKLVKNSILTHNHPRGWAAKSGTIGRIGNSFSKDDLVFAVKNDVAEIRAVTPTFTFSMKRPDGGWGTSANSLESAFDNAYASVRKYTDAYLSIVGHSQATYDRANVVFYHKINKILAEKYGWIYSKQKNSLIFV